MNRVLGHYELEVLLGEGAMGQVFRARDLVLERFVAVKVISPGLTDPSFLQRFRREAKLAAQLNHPNIATIHALGEEQGQAWLVFEYVEGETLEHALRSGPLPLETVRRIGMQTAAGLAEAHARDIVHRDIKPGNIMSARSGSIKIMDFGIARRGSDATLTVAGSVVGTPKTMAPETVRGAEPGPAADLFSLGCVLYEALTGREPFAGADVLAVLYRIAHEDPTPLRTLRPDVPDDLAAVVEELLVKDPVRRLGPAREVERRLEACWVTSASMSGLGPSAIGKTAETPASARKPSEGSGRDATREAAATLVMPRARRTRRTYIQYAVVLVLVVAGAFWTASERRAKGAAELRRLTRSEADRALQLLERYRDAPAVPAESLAAMRGHAERAVLLDSTQVNAWRVLAWASERGRDPVRAEQALRRVVALDPGSTSARLRLAEMYARQSRWREAESESRAALRADSTSAEAMRTLIQVLTAQGKYEDLAVELRAASRRWPEAAPMWEVGRPPAHGSVSPLSDPAAFEAALQVRIERARVVAESLAIHGGRSERLPAMHPDSLGMLRPRPERPIPPLPPGRHP